MSTFHYHCTDHGHGPGLTNNYLEVLGMRFAWLSGWPSHWSRSDEGRRRLTEDYIRSSFRRRWLERWTNDQWYREHYGVGRVVEQAPPEVRLVEPVLEVPTGIRDIRI